MNESIHVSCEANESIHDTGEANESIHDTGEANERALIGYSCLATFQWLSCLHWSIIGLRIGFDFAGNFAG